MKHLYAERIFWYHHVVAQNALLLQETSWWSKVEKIAGFFKGRNETKPDLTDQAFLHFYLTSTADLCIQFLSINIILLVVSIYIITQEHWGLLRFVSIDESFQYFSPAVIDIVIWIILSVMCLGYFLILKYKPEWFNTPLMPTEQTVWYELGASILAARLLMLVVQFTIMRQENDKCDKCFDGYALSSPESTSFGLTFIKMTIDAYQGYAFVILPFPQPWALAFAIIELVRQEIRLLSSAHRILLNPENKWIVIFVGILIALMYITVLFVPSAYLEGSMQNRFKRVSLRQQAEEIKQEMVVFLSTDVRAPLQYMLHSIATVEFAELTGSSTQPLLKDIEQHTRTVNDVADDLLLLVRIQEKRYTSKMALVPDLRVLFEGIVQVVLQRRLVERAEGATEGHAMNSAAMPPSTTPARDCFVYTDVPTIEVSVDEKCLVAVLRHLLIFITQEKVSYASPDSPLATFALDLSVEVVDNLWSLEGKQALQVVLSGEAATPKDWSEQRRVHEATTAYICNSIASSCGGSFTSKGFSYTLVIPCLVTANDNSEEHIDVGRGEPPSPNSVRAFDDGVRHFDAEVASVQTNARSVGTHHLPPTRLPVSASVVQNPDRAVLEAKIQASSDMQTRFKRNRVCVIVDDTVMESIITSVITKLRLNDNMSILHELQRGQYVPVAKLTFVTSYELCAELRRRRYTGLIVLFSGSINYLDDTQVANLDYNLPLPASDGQLILFIDWLIEKHDAAARKEVARRRDAPVRDRDVLRRRRNSEAVVDGRGNEPASVSTVHKAHPFVLMRCLAHVCDWCGSFWDALFDNDRYFMVTRLPEGSAESYSKWRWLNPSNSWRHHATEQYFTTLTRTIFILFVQLGLLQLQAKVLLPTLLVGIVYLIMPYMYRYVLEPCNVKLRHFWQIPNLAILVSNLVVIIRAFGDSPSDTKDMTLTMFLRTTFAHSSGAECLYSLLMLLTYSRLYFMYQTHPLNIVGMLIFFTRHTQILWIAFRTIMSAQMCQFLQLIFIQMTVLNIIYLTYLEDTYRREFKTAHEHILARAFLDQCLDICQHDIRKPLEFLLQRQKDLMQVAVHAGYIRLFKINRSFLGKLEPLHVSGALLSEMAQELTFIRHNILTINASAVAQPIDHMKAHYSMNSMQLHRAVAGLISSLSSTAESSNVKIYAEVDNKLAVIRVDWKNLSMILTNLVSAALRNIRDFCIETPRNKDLVSYIKIKMVAIDSEAKVPFVHPRVMLINVCDSSNAAAKAAALDRSAASRHPVVDRYDQHASNRKQSDGGNSVSDITEQRDRYTSQYGRSTCEQLVRKLTPSPVFQTIAVQSVLQTVQRFTFQYHLTPQTRRSQDYIQAETDLPYLTVLSNVNQYLAAYKRIIYPPKAFNPTSGEATPNKEVVYFTSILVAQRNDVMKLIAQFQWMFWNCTAKYILNIPSMHSVAGADCVLIDYQLEGQEGVNISDTVLKLRVCGFNGVVAVVLQEGLRDCDLIRDELSKSAADVDLIFSAPIRDQHIQAMTVALEKKTVRQLLYMNGNG